jgi:site-specific recombinase XerD
VYNQGLEAFYKFRRECSLGGLWPIPLSGIVDFIAYMYTSGMFRVSELTTLSNSAFNHAVPLGEVNRSKDGLEVFLKTSKTDQFGAERTIYISSQSSKHLCPLLAVNNFLDCRPKIDGPLFCHYDSKPLTRYQFSAILKRCLSILSVP